MKDVTHEMSTKGKDNPFRIYNLTLFEVIYLNIDRLRDQSRTESDFRVHTGHGDRGGKGTASDVKSPEQHRYLTKRSAVSTDKMARSAEGFHLQRYITQNI